MEVLKRRVCGRRVMKRVEDAKRPRGELSVRITSAFTSACA